MAKADKSTTVSGARVRKIPTVFSKGSPKERPHIFKKRSTIFDDYKPGRNPPRLNMSREAPSKNVVDLTAMSPRDRNRYEMASTVDSYVAKSINRRRKADRYP